MALVRSIHHVAFAEDGRQDILRCFTELLELPVAHVEYAGGFTERMLPLGDCWLQALEATGDGVVRRSVERRGPGLHHIAFHVDDLDTVIATLRSRGVDFVDPGARAGGMGTRIAFAHPRAFGGVLVEFVELAMSGARAGGPPSTTGESDRLPLGGARSHRHGENACDYER